MALSVGTSARNAACDAVVDLIDVGAGAGVLRIYSGSKPANPQTTASGTLLAEITLNDPAFGAASSGVATISTSPAIADSSANATGTAGWFRICDPAEAAGTGLGIIDGTVTATGGGGDLTLDSVSIVSATTVTVTGGTVTMPA